MTVYVDDVRHPLGRMIMCHMWADTVDELHEVARKLGLRREWFQCPPKSSWEHYDVSLSAKARVLAMGAVMTDKFGLVEHVARLRGDDKKIRQIAYSRALRQPGRTAKELEHLREEALRP